MQMELKACFDEVDWTTICHNCEAFNFPQDEYPPRSLPISPSYIDNLQSRLVKVKKCILPSTLKMILETFYHLPARQAPITSPTVQPDDMMWRHRDGEHNPLERPQALEEKENVVADGTSSTDKGGYFVSKTEVGMDHEASHVAAHHFKLAMIRQQGTTAKSTDWGGDYPIQGDFAGNPETVTAARIAAREEATIGRHQRGTTSTDQNKQFDPGGTTGELFISAKWLCCILYALLCVFIRFCLSCNFSC